MLKRLDNSRLTLIWPCSDLTPEAIPDRPLTKGLILKLDDVVALGPCGKIASHLDDYKDHPSRWLSLYLFTEVDLI